MNPVVPPLGRCPRCFLIVLMLSGLIATAASSLAKPGKEERAMKREFGADDPGAKSKNRDLPSDARDRKAGAADPQGRTMSKLREQMEVDDDDEWTVISARMAKLDEIRRGVSSGAAGARGSAPTGDRGKRTSGNIERDSLRAAVSDKLPEAEIKGRLARARDAYREDEERLSMAQSDLRAVLTVRQEAIAVLAGLLPP